MSTSDDLNDSVNALKLNIKKEEKRRRSSAESSTSAITISSSDSGVGSNEENHLNFKLRSYVTTKHSQKLYGVAFNNFLKAGQPKIFAVCGGTRCSIYECSSNGDMKLVKELVDPTEFMSIKGPNKREDFWTCCWTVDSIKKRSVLITAGQLGVIRILQPERDDWCESSKHLIGHGDAINQLKIAPRFPFLLASASSDHSFRLWNIETGVCIATFHGDQAHRDGVITIDFNRESTKLVSGGFDHLLAIWDLTVPEITKAIEDSRHYDEQKSERAPKTVLQCFPIFRTRQIHSNYIDTVQWFGDMILSKSCENEYIHCWAPRLLADDIPIKNAKNVYTIVAKFEMSDSEYYFERFATDCDMSLMACGNDIGDIFVYDLTANDPADIPCVVLKHPKRKQTVREVSFSRCGNELVVCTDAGTIWHYHRN